MNRRMFILAGAAALAGLSAVALPHIAAAGSARDETRAALSARIAELGRSFGPEVGISVRDVADGWTTGYEPTRLNPQQSVSKLWVALAVHAAFDRGTLSPEDTVTITPADLTLFHQPIRALVGTDGYTTTIADLLERAMTQSDNTANDALLRRVGGPEAIRALLAKMGIQNVRFGPGERQMQSRIAGLTWKQIYSQSNAFYKARAALPAETRREALEAYIANPVDGASAGAITLALARLARGELLSARQTANLLALMERSKTGAKRMKAGIDPDWQLAHKTGTGQQVGALVAGFNDVGLLTAPDGRQYAVAVMIARSGRPIGQRQALIASVTRAVIDHWRGVATAMRHSDRQP